LPCTKAGKEGREEEGEEEGREEEGEEGRQAWRRRAVSRGQTLAGRKGGRW